MNRDWFNSEQDGFRARILLSPYDNITVGSCPLDGMTLETAQSFDSFINLCENPLYSLDDRKPGLRTAYYWIPIKELEVWGENKIESIRDILDFEYDNQRKVYLHCAAGTNRSPCVAMNWLMISRGHSLEEAAFILTRDEGSAKIFQSKYRLNIEQGYLSELE